MATSKAHRAAVGGPATTSRRWKKSWKAACKERRPAWHVVVIDLDDGVAAPSAIARKAPDSAPTPECRLPHERMEIVVINLQSHTQRWQEAARQFDALGLRPVRQEAVSGERLDEHDIRKLYSERLNRRQYHEPLRRGEIGCYASHLQAWQRLVDSGDPAMAIFEDDIQVDSDLADVLERLQSGARPGQGWDIVKLLGRSHEKLSDSQPLLGDRCLVDYRRVPSFTGAYVITASGAAKLLARRPPFGRPVDIDIRHWWECDLVVRGVYPYPVRPAPSSLTSSIGHGRSGKPLDGRVRRLSLQAVYTWRNWHARQIRRRSLETDAAQSATPVASPRPRSTVRPPGIGERAAGTRRNLVVVRAGDASLHPGWLRGQARDFDVFVSYYGATPDRHRADADYYESRPGPKWPGIAALLAEHPCLFERYDAVWFPDDDLLADASSLNRLFAFFCAFRLNLAQPALTRDSYFTWSTLLQQPGCHVRYNGFVEVMAPLFSREALRVCAPTFSQSRSGWGLDWVWPTLCRRAGLGRIGIVDATPVRHTRPVGGELYRNHPDMDPRGDAARLLSAYGINEVRALAKYSFRGQVRDEALPLGQRLVFWLKRLNGRRKHRATA
jgi:GR25 family glycosyltransferase involved in LPS biosynthesis